MEKVIVTSAKNADDGVNYFLKAGWKVKFVVAEYVSISVAGVRGNGYNTEESRGRIVFVLEKEDK